MAFSKLKIGLILEAAQQRNAVDAESDPAEKEKLGIVNNYVNKVAQSKYDDLKKETNFDDYDESGNFNEILKILSIDGNFEQDQYELFFNMNKENIKAFTVLKSNSARKLFLENNFALVCKISFDCIYTWCIVINIKEKFIHMELVSRTTKIIQRILESSQSEKVDNIQCIDVFFQRRRFEMELHNFYLDIDNRARRKTDEENNESELVLNTQVPQDDGGEGITTSEEIRTNDMEK